MRETIVATVRATIVKPLGDLSWDDLGACLRALRAPLHRVMNKAITELEMTATGKLLGIEERHMRTASYQVVRDYWRIEREAAAERVAKRKAYSGDELIATVEPASSVILGMAGEVFARWQRFDKTRWKGEMVMPTFRREQPIAIASSGEAIALTVEDGSLVLDVRLVAGAPRVRLVLAPCGASHAAELRRAAINPDTVGSCKIVHNGHRAKDGAWMVLLSVKRQPFARDGVRTMAVHRGLRTFLTIAIGGNDGGEAWTSTLADGGDIVQHKRGYEARRRSLGRHQRERGSGARGHGKERRFEAITKLETSEANYIKTRCQQIAAQVVRLAGKHNVGRVLVEDWSNPVSPGLDDFSDRLIRSFPFAQLKGCIEWACKNAGIPVEEVPTIGNSRRCPRCRHEHDIAQHPTFRCAECQLERSVEMTFAWNMLVEHAGLSGERLVEDHNRARKRAIRRMMK